MTTAVIDRPGLAAAPAGERLHALDALRGFALLCGVVLHAAMSYLPGFDVWPLLDRSTSTTLGVSVLRHPHVPDDGVLRHRRLLRAPAGRAARRARVRPQPQPCASWCRSSSAGSCSSSDDCRRDVVGPGRAAAASGRGRQPPTAPLLAFPLTHLWFLYVLTLLYAAALPVRGLVRSTLDTGGRLRARSTPGSASPCAAPGRRSSWALPLAIAFLDSTWLLWAGIPTPDQSLDPEPAGGGRVLGRAFSSAGCCTARPRCWRPSSASGRLQLGSGERADRRVPVDRRPDAIGRDGGLRSADRGLRRAVCRGGMGVDAGPHRHRAALLRRPKAPCARYVSDASYWIYLAHLPVLIGAAGGR